MYTNPINNLDDTINVEDLTDRIDDLQEEIDNIDDMPEGDQLKDTAEGQALREELTKLTALINELQGMGGDHQWRGDWYPATLIRDSYFETAMDEMVADCYTFPELPSFMKITLDYVALQQDYSSVEVDDVTYWCR